MSKRIVLAIVTAALVVCAAQPATAATSAKVDPRLDALVQQYGPTVDLPVIVYGTNLDAAANKAHMQKRRQLDEFGAVSGDVYGKDLATLANVQSVSYVALDPATEPTGNVDLASLSTASLAAPPVEVDNARAAWARGLGGSGVGVLVIDSGLARATDFNTVLGRDGYDRGIDSYGHGTFVADLVAGVSGDLAVGKVVGVAPQSGIYGLNVAYNDTTRTSDVIAGLQWAIVNKARYGLGVVVLALSEQTQSSYRADALDSAVEDAWRHGLVVVVSAGNRGAGQIDYAPANDPFVITVGATDIRNTTVTSDDVPAWFSSSGTTVDGYAKPELLAPGTHVLGLLPRTSTLGQRAPLTSWADTGYAFMSGTSFSAPQVAGAAAIVLQQHPSLSPDQVKWLLAATVRNVAGTSTGALDLAGATAFADRIQSANVGVPPSHYGLKGSSTADFSSNSWNSNGWNGAGWTSNSWNSNSWNSNTWNWFLAG